MFSCFIVIASLLAAHTAPLGKTPPSQSIDLIEEEEEELVDEDETEDDL